MKKIRAEGDHLILEKIDYDKEQVTDSGIIVKMSQTLDGSFCEARILSMGSGLPILNGEIPEVGYKEGDIILYDVRSRIGTHNDFDIIRREHVVGVLEG
jgi:co-chaperonin GroES (HSP10)